MDVFSHAVVKVESETTDQFWEESDTVEANDSSNFAVHEEQDMSTQHHDSSSATGELPCTESWPGYLDFDITFPGGVGRKIYSEYSSLLDKIFADSSSNMTGQVHLDWAKCSQPNQLLVRIQAVFVGEHASQLVQRCPVHAKTHRCGGEEETSEEREQVIRLENRRAVYHRDPNSGRLSVTLQLETPQPGTDYNMLIFRFMCFGSCAGGISRRPLRLVFTLENMKNQKVMGRRSFALRVCSCPRRDRKKEEESIITSQAPDLSSALTMRESGKKRRHNEIRTESEVEASLDGSKKVVWSARELTMLPIPKEHYTEVVEYVRLKLKSDAFSRYDREDTINRLESWESIRLKMEEKYKR